MSTWPVPYVSWHGLLCIQVYQFMIVCAGVCESVLGLWSSQVSVHVKPLIAPEAFKHRTWLPDISLDRGGKVSHGSRLSNASHASPLGVIFRSSRRTPCAHPHFTNVLRSCQKYQQHDTHHMGYNLCVSNIFRKKTSLFPQFMLFWLYCSLISYSPRTQHLVYVWCIDAKVQYTCQPTCMTIFMTCVWHITYISSIMIHHDWL